MQKILLLALLLMTLACDDGDIQIGTLDFDSTTIQVCDDNPVEANMTNVLFKLNDTEALILELPANAILNEVSETQIEIGVSSTSGPAKITYRTFSGQVSKDYFCSKIPLTDPIVLEEILGEGGDVYINTAISADSTKYEHTITLNDISLITSDNNRITNLSINNFGTVTTKVPAEEE